MNLGSQSDDGLIFCNPAEAIVFSSKCYGAWEVDLNDIALVGEYTTQDGPILADHFLVFVSKGGQEYECPLSIRGVSDVLLIVGKKLGSEISACLTLSTDFESRIMAPKAVKDLPLYIFEVTEEGSIFTNVFSGGRISRRLSQQALSILQPQK